MIEGVDYETIVWNRNPFAEAVSLACVCLMEYYTRTVASAFQIHKPPRSIVIHQLKFNVILQSL